MSFAYGYYDPRYGGGAGGEAASTDTWYPSYTALGAFTGTSGLPTSINSPADFDAYVDALLAKTDEISPDGVNLTFDGATGRYVGVGGDGDDTFAATNASTGPGLLMGRDGNDTLTGGPNGDTLYGGAGNDVLNSNGSDDKLVGGPGADRIDFSSFASAEIGHVAALGAGDVVDLSDAAASYGLSMFTAVDRFGHHDGAGDVVATYNALHDRTIFRFDVDGDHKTDHKLVVLNGDYTDFAQFTGIDTSHLSSADGWHGLVT